MGKALSNKWDIEIINTSLMPALLVVDKVIACSKKTNAFGN
jgi:hypothetical protein